MGAFLEMLGSFTIAMLMPRWLIVAFTLGELCSAMKIAVEEMT
jgi:hypothetical protein